MKCSKCLQDFEEREIQQSHNVPAYLFYGDRPRRKRQADIYGVTPLCKPCHDLYEKMIVEVLVLNLYNYSKKIDDEEIISWMKKLFRKCTAEGIRDRAIKICKKMLEEWLNGSN